MRIAHNIINYIIHHARTRPVNGRCTHPATTTRAIKAIEDGFSRPRTMTLLLTIRRCVHNIINYIIHHARTRPADNRCAHWATTAMAIKAIEVGRAPRLYYLRPGAALDNQTPLRPRRAAYRELAHCVRGAIVVCRPRPPAGPPTPARRPPPARPRCAAAHIGG